MSAMSPAMTGLTIGAVFGVANFAILRWMASRTEAQMPSADGRKRAGILRIAALADLVVFPALGYLLGPIVLA
jgi:uncharacterized Tic20 family protein